MMSAMEQQINRTTYSCRGADGKRPAWHSHPPALEVIMCDQLSRLDPTLVARSMYQGHPLLLFQYTHI